MRITTRLVLDMETYQVLEHEFYEYDGPIAMCGGGPAPEQKAAAARDAALSEREQQLAEEKNARETQAFNLIMPYASDRLKNGLPYYNNLVDSNGGNIARAYAPAFARVNRAFAGSDLPSGSREAALAGVDADKARAFDSTLTGTQEAQERAKANAAGLLAGQQQIENAVPYFSGAAGANNSIMQAPLQSQGLGGILGGALQGVGSAAINKIPF